MSELTVRELTQEDAEAWSRLHRASDQHLGLAWGFCDCVAAGVGRAVRVGAFQNDRLLAGLAFVERRVRGIRMWRHLAPAPFAGLLHERGKANESFLRDVLGALGTFVSVHVPMAEVIFHPDLQDVRGLLWTGWTAHPRYNYVSEINGDGALSKAAENSVRRQAAKAREAGLMLHALGEEGESVLRVWDATRRRQGIPDWIPRQNFIELARWANSPENGSRHGGFFSIGRGADSPEAALLAAADPQRVYYLMGASKLEDGEKGTGAPTLLHIAATEEIFRQRGAFLYDWCGANTPSVAQFKKKFRPRLEITMQAVWKSRWARWVV